MDSSHPLTRIPGNSSVQFPMPPLHNVDSPPPSVIERVTDFVSEHKKTIAIAAAAVAVAGVGVAYYASTSKAPSTGGAGETSKPGKEKKKKTGSRGAKKSGKKVGAADGPVLEERKPKVEESKGSFEMYLVLLFHSLPTLVFRRKS